MLNRPRLLREIERAADELFIDRSADYEIVARAWQALSADSTFSYKVREVGAPWPVPSWEGNPSRVIPVLGEISAYAALSVDGSQIYPDRHQGVSCFLINVGSVVLRYGVAGKPVLFDSEPYIFSGESKVCGAIEPSQDLVNALRQEHELRAGHELGVSAGAGGNDAYLLLFDGSLIFWNLESKEHSLREYFLPRYFNLLNRLYSDRIMFASYISLPRSRELVNLVRLFLCDFDPSQPEKYAAADHAVDATIAQFFLAEGERSIVFQNNASVSAKYPEYLRPFFFYINVGNEIGRVEIPAWIAQDEVVLNQVAASVLDQWRKGHGYPVCLAEAHEQAVVKGPDRDFFYHLLEKVRVGRGQRSVFSQKLARKRIMGV